jgi:hypothetical protein
MAREYPWLKVIGHKQDENICDWKMKDMSTMN